MTPPVTPDPQRPDMTDEELIAEARNRIDGGGRWPAMRRADLERLIALASRSLVPAADTTSREVEEMVEQAARDLYAWQQEGHGIPWDLRREEFKNLHREQARVALHPALTRLSTRLREAEAPRESAPITEAQIKYMVDRFLGWRLPENFSPDAGISFKATFNDHLPCPTKHEPSGTNLFDATQATEMVRYMVEGMQHHAARQRQEGQK